jgi:hypothetical protein
METSSPFANGNLIHQLRERIKELECIYAISAISANPAASFDQIVQDITGRIPAAFQQPEQTCARVIIGSKVAQTANFSPCPWRLDVEITVDGKVAHRSKGSPQKHYPARVTVSGLHS